MTAYPVVSLKRISAGFAVMILAATAHAHAHAATEKTLYSFLGKQDGQLPVGSLIDVGDLLYGTVFEGGTQFSKGGVFKVNRTTGAEAILHSFGGSEGSLAVAGLLDVGGVFYGSTTKGGQGKLFKMTPAGVETVLYTFNHKPDGAQPQATLIKLDSTTLYGTTANGGASGKGTVFSVTTAGEEKVVYSFKGGVDGANPSNGSLIRVAGRLPLYGTTIAGGARKLGTVFKVTTGGTEAVMHAFKGGNDGSLLEGGLIYVGGQLWGTTAFGGDATCNGGYGCGTVFTVNPDTGVETVVYAFKDASVAAYPYSSLFNLNGTLYGTTYLGGSSGYRCGTIFSVNPTTSAVAVIYSFLGQNSGDGCRPQASLIAKGGTLYGTTTAGGTADYGAVFAITP